VEEPLQEPSPSEPDLAEESPTETGAGVPAPLTADDVVRAAPGAPPCRPARQGGDAPDRPGSANSRGNLDKICQEFRLQVREMIAERDATSPAAAADASHAKLQEPDGEELELSASANAVVTEAAVADMAGSVMAELGQTGAGATGADGLAEEM